MVMVYKLGNIFYKLHTRKGETNNFEIAYDEKISWQYPKMQTIKIIDGFTTPERMSPSWVEAGASRRESRVEPI